MAKIVLVILDGLGDTTHKIGSRSGTTLALANRENLDTLAASGITGLMDSVSPGYACGSDTAHLSLFGYSPFQYYNGRGAFEALGGGMHMNPGDIAFKSNFSTMSGDIVTLRRCDRAFEHTGPGLCADLDGMTIPEYPEVKVRVSYATEHRCAVCISAPGLSDRITGTDPISDDLPLRKSVPRDNSEASAHTAAIVNALSDELRRKLEAHPVNAERRRAGKPPANVILLRGPGMRLDVQPFSERHGLRAFMIAPTAIIAGIGISVGLQLLHVDGATGDQHSNYEAKAVAAADALESGEWDMGIIHMKGIDDAAHDGLVEGELGKKALIERADRAIGTLVRRLNALGSRFVFAVIADHTTSARWRDHTFEPVPVIVTAIGGALGVPPDGVSRYTELEAARGALGRFCGSGLIPALKVLAGR